MSPPLPLAFLPCRRTTYGTTAHERPPESIASSASALYVFGAASRNLQLLCVTMCRMNERPLLHGPSIFPSLQCGGPGIASLIPLQLELSHLPQSSKHGPEWRRAQSVHTPNPPIPTQTSASPPGHLICLLFHAGTVRAYLATAGLPVPRQHGRRKGLSLPCPEQPLRSCGIKSMGCDL